MLLIHDVSFSVIDGMQVRICCVVIYRTASLFIELIVLKLVFLLNFLNSKCLELRYIVNELSYGYESE